MKIEKNYIMIMRILFLCTFAVQVQVQAQEINSSVRNGRLDQVKVILNTSPGLINSKDSKGNTPLHNAVLKGRRDIAVHLLKKGAGVNIKNKNGQAPLFIALDRGRNSIARILIQNGADVNAKGYRNRTLLHMAARTSSLDVTGELIKKGADVNARDSRGATPLRMVFSNGFQFSPGKTGTAKLLIAGGADVNEKYPGGGSPVIEAFNQKQKDIILYMIKYGLNIKSSEFDGRTLLHRAVSLGYPEIVKVLLEKGADINARTSDGRTPADYAKKYGHEEITEMLGDYGAVPGDNNSVVCMIPSVKDNLEEGQAVIWYLGTSGWAVKTSRHLLVFDYINRGVSSPGLFLKDGVINTHEIKDCSIYVFVTHKHGDHYDKSIFNWKKSVKEIKYIFGWNNKNRENNICIEPGESQKIDDVEVLAAKADHGSERNNDGGVVFVVKAGGLTFYHSGDHGGLGKELTVNYKKPLDYLSLKNVKVDIAFVYTHFRDGIYYTIDKISPETVFPMHSFGHEYNYRNFAKEAKSKNVKTAVACAEFRGDRFFFKNGIIK